jgi:hypothetical protein
MSRPLALQSQDADGPPLSIRLSPDEVEALVRTYVFSKESIHEEHITMPIVFRKG